MFGVGKFLRNAAKTVVHVAEDAGKAVGDVVEKGAGAMGDVAEGAVDVAGDVGKGGFNAAKYLASEGWHTAEKAASASASAIVHVGREGFELGRDAGDALAKGTFKGASWAVNLVEAGRRKVGEWGADLVGRALGRRAGDVFRSLYDHSTGWSIGAAQNLVEGADTLRQGATKLARGDLKGAARDLGEGAFKIVVQTPVDAIISTGAGAVEAVQSILGIDPPSRGVTDAEVAELRKIFGDSVDYSQVRIKEGDGGFFGSGGLLTLGGRPRSVMGTIYIPSGYIEKKVEKKLDRAIAGLNAERQRNGDLPLSEAEEQTKRGELYAETERQVRMTLLVHEVTHVWQYQNGGDDYAGEAIWSQIARGGYDLDKVAELGWHRLSPEQQGALLEEAYKDGFFDDPANAKVETDSGVDLTELAREAHERVKKGEGAP